MRNIIRFLCKNGGFGSDFLAIGSFLTDGKNTEHGVTDRQVGYVATDFAYDA